MENKRLGKKFYVKLDISKGELRNILEEMEACFRRIHDCYYELERLGLVFREEASEEGASEKN